MGCVPSVGLPSAAVGSALSGNPELLPIVSVRAATHHRRNGQPLFIRSSLRIARDTRRGAGSFAWAGRHVGERGIGDQRGDRGDIGSTFHASMRTEASMSPKRVASLQMPLANARAWRRSNAESFRESMTE
jgi:hypothetical protein